jgi:hypothetical protein
MLRLIESVAYSFPSSNFRDRFCSRARGTEEPVVEWLVGGIAGILRICTYRLRRALGRSATTK